VSSRQDVQPSQAQNVAKVLRQVVASSQPIALDFFCGRGGWTRGLIAAGWRVIGIDLVHYPDYPGEFVQADVRQIDAGRLREIGARLFVASPPCRDFSDLKRLFGIRAAQPDVELIRKTICLARESGIPFVMENVRGLEEHFSPAVGHYGPFYLWGDIRPDQIPRFLGRSQKMRGKDPSERAMIPFNLAFAIGKAFWPADIVSPSQALQPAATRRQVVVPIGRWTLAEIESAVFEATLQETRGDKFLAAKMLGISSRTLQRWFRARATSCPQRSERGAENLAFAGD